MTFHDSYTNIDEIIENLAERKINGEEDDTEIYLQYKIHI